MKNVVVSTLLLSSLFTACGLKEQKKIDMAKVEELQDSIPHIIPGTRSIHTMQDDDFSKVTIVVGAPAYYSAADNQKQQAAVNVGAMLLRVLGPDNSISSATLAITMKDQNDYAMPTDAIKLDMKIDSLKKVIYPSK